MSRRARRVPPVCSLPLALAALLCLGLGCPPSPGPLLPVPGVPETAVLALVAVPGGRVNVAGGTFLVERTDLALDTRLGAHAIGASYDSARRDWRWSFELHFDGSTFVDASGVAHAIAALPDGSAIPGTSWVRVDAATLRTKGGLVHRFAPDGRLVRVRWASSSWPRLVYVAQAVAGAVRIVRVEQCTSASSCATVFDLVRDAAGRVAAIDDRAGRRAEFAYGADGRLAAARDGLDVARGWPGFRYEYDAGGRLVALTNSEGERVEVRYADGRAVEVEAIGEEHPLFRFAYRARGAGTWSTDVTDPTGATSALRYDGQRRVVERENPLGETWRFAWSGKRVAQVTDPAGVATSSLWLDDDLASLVQPSGNVVRFTYQPR